MKVRFWKNILVLTVFSFILFSCGNQDYKKDSNQDFATGYEGESEEEGGYENKEYMEESTEESAEDDLINQEDEKLQDIKPDQLKKNTQDDLNKQDFSKISKKIIKTADVKYKVKNVKASTKDVHKLIEKLGGYISQEDFKTEDVATVEQEVIGDSMVKKVEYRISNQIVIRIPTKNFEKFLNITGKNAVSVDYKNVKAMDVTEKYVDLSTRLQTKKTIEKRYIDILRNKAKTMHDVLEAEEKIRMLREEIEAVEGKLKYLSNQVKFSTINLNLYQESLFRMEKSAYYEHQGDVVSFWDELGDSFSSGWDLILDFILGFVHIWPFSIPITIVVIWAIRKFKHRKKTNETSEN